MSEPMEDKRVYYHADGGECIGAYVQYDSGWTATCSRPHYDKPPMEDKRLEVKADVMAWLHNDLGEYASGNISIGIMCERIAVMILAERDKLRVVEAERDASDAVLAQATNSCSMLYEDRERLTNQVTTLQSQITALKEVVNGASLHPETGVSLVDDVRDLVKERDRLTYAIGEWKREEVLWKEREVELLMVLEFYKVLAGMGGPVEPRKVFGEIERIISSGISEVAGYKAQVAGQAHYIKCLLDEVRELKERIAEFVKGA